MTRTFAAPLATALFAVALTACGGGDTADAAPPTAEADPGSCVYVDPEALDSRLGGTPTTTPGPDGACTLALDGTDIATIQVTDFNQAAYDSGVAELADANNIGNAGVEGKLSGVRSVARVGDHLVTAELLGGDRTLPYWLDVVWTEVAGG